MKLRYTKSKILGLRIIYPLTNFKDKRGNYVQLFHKKIYKDTLNKTFKESDISCSKHNFLRVIHGDNKTTKLISCLYGKFFFVVVNNDKKSKNYLKSESFILSDQNRIQIEVPPKHGNGHFVLSHYSIFHYMQTNYYDRKSQFTINWKDKRININWPKSCKKPIISERDS